ncbi:MAG: tripartite tricarboxylate transporter permease [Eubacteriales bacterium]|nr:tripartite tricarboxylate transporter permease [Eubacteriales bacterium]
MFTLASVLFCFIGTCIGIIFGAIPGLTTTMAIALFLPFTFGMEAIPAFALLLGLYCGGVYGGSITAILINTPGTPAAAATALDGYPLARQGKALEALSLATLASFIGGMFSCIVLILVAPQLAKVALSFGPPEYFAISFFGLSMVATLAADNIVKGVIAACFGLFIAMIGIDPIGGSLRFTFGTIHLIAGIDLICALIGLFAISEVFSKLETIYRDKGLGHMEQIKGKFVTLKILKANAFNFLRSSIIGTIIGIIPATGVGMANWVSYNEAKRATRHPELFGKGSYEGVAASEAANNAVTGGAMVPLLTLGVPGDTMTAILLGALMIQGLAPGPKLFIDHPEVVTGIYGMLALANFFMLAVGLGLINLFVKIIKVPAKVLMPLVLIMCFVGSYAIQNSLFDVYVTLIFGIIGYLLVKAKFPIPPILLGIILGPLIESNFRRSITMSRGDMSIFFTRPISAVFIGIALIAMVAPILREKLTAKKA